MKKVKKMKKIVVYQSKTGFTAKYANWITERLGCEAKEYKRVNSKELADYDMVIYGGCIMADMVIGYNKIKALNLNNVIVFAVGITVPSEEVAWGWLWSTKVKLYEEDNDKYD